MMVETDVLYAYVKRKDWLKPVADRLLRRVAEGEFGIIYASRESLHEMYYVSLEEGVPLDEIISRFALLTSIDNLIFLETTYEIDLLALTLMKQFKLASIFDAYYAATALNQVPDHTIITTDTAYDRIPGVRRVDPREL
ncbi:MAG: type II toxin-antitoxin system VapC family toxin [Thermofilaceae archaeon]